MDKIEITIIVPVYNAETYIKACIDSLLCQTFKNIEILLINDGSTDSTLEICRQYAENNANIRICSQSNGGPSKARNTGLKTAKGNWILFVDADDQVDQQICERLYNISIEYQADMVFCNMIDRSPEKANKIMPFKENIRIFEGNSLNALEACCISKETETGSSLINLTGPVCKLIRKEVVRDLAFPESLNLGEDTCFIQQLFQNLSKAVYDNEFLYFRNIRETSLSHGLGEDTAERMAGYTNWVKSYYQQRPDMQEALELLEMKNVIKITDQYFWLMNIEKKAGIKQVKQYLRSTSFKTTFHKIQKSSLAFGGKIKLYLIQLKLYQLLYLLYKIKDVRNKRRATQ